MKEIHKGIGYIALAAICIAILYLTKEATLVVMLAAIGFYFLSD